MRRLILATALVVAAIMPEAAHADGPVTVAVARGYHTLAFSVSSLDACRRFLSEYSEPGMCIDNQSGSILERWTCGRTFEGQAACQPLAGPPSKKD